MCYSVPFRENKSLECRLDPQEQLDYAIKRNYGDKIVLSKSLYYTCIFQEGDGQQLLIKMKKHTERENRTPEG